MTSSSISQFIKATKHSLKAVIADLWDAHIFDMAIELIENGVEVLLIFPDHRQRNLTNEPFILNRIILVNKKGGLICFGDDNQINENSFFIRDYEAVASVKNQDASTLNEHISPGTIRQHLDVFDKLFSESEYYLHNTNDLDIDFQLSHEVILAGDQIQLSWEVDHADKVVIQGIGEVEPIGHKKIRPAINTIFKIGAYNEHQSAFRTKCVKVYEDIDITYDLSFINSRTNEVTSLVKEENFPHVFGVANGNEIKFQWSVKDANSVKILPFDLRKHTGENYFKPSENIDIEIHVEIYDRKFIRKIQILVFPIPVLKSHLKTTFELPQEFYHNLPDQTENDKLLSYISKTQDAYSQPLDEILLKEKKRYGDLNDQLLKLNFDNSDNKYNLSSFNKGILAKLQRIYSKKPHIGEVIQSIKAYYDRPQKRK
ncbi:MAG: hypothetical protein AAFN93_10470 [Bacteroidota bacterium]